MDYALVLTGLALTASILYYSLTLRNANKTQQMQLETRQAQVFMNIYNQSQTDPAFINSWRIFITKQWKDEHEFIELFNPSNPSDDEFYIAMGHIGSFYEGLGVFVKEKLLDIRLLALLMSGMTIMFWKKVAPVVEPFREAYNFPWLSETEYLYNALQKYLEENPDIHG